jgi:hypothetical protein
MFLVEMFLDAGGSFSLPRSALRVIDARIVAAVSMQTGARPRTLLDIGEFENERRLCSTFLDTIARDKSPFVSSNTYSAQVAEEHSGP